MELVPICLIKIKQVDLPAPPPCHGNTIQAGSCTWRFSLRDWKLLFTQAQSVLRFSSPTVGRMPVAFVVPTSTPKWEYKMGIGVLLGILEFLWIPFLNRKNDCSSLVFLRVLALNICCAANCRKNCRDSLCTLRNPYEGTCIVVLFISMARVWQGKGGLTSQVVKPNTKAWK